MHIGVTTQQEQLEKQHAGRPHRRRATKPWQDELANQWLNLEEEKCSYEYCQRINNHAPHFARFRFASPARFQACETCRPAENEPTGELYVKIGPAFAGPFGLEAAAFPPNDRGFSPMPSLPATSGREGG